MNATKVKNVAGLAVMLLAFTSLHASPPATPRTALFGGVWSVKWCDKSQAASECGRFTALLVQDGERLCGRFSGVRPGTTQIDEGEPRSIRGLVIDDAAVVAATSSRNEGTYLVRLERKGNDIHWRLGEQVGVGDNGDIQLLAIDEVLSRRDGASDQEELTVVKAECQVTTPE